MSTTITYAKPKFAENTMKIPKTGETIRIRSMLESDFAGVELLAQTVMFNVGIHNMALYFRSSPGAWQVALNESDELVALMGNNGPLENKDMNQAYYGYIVIVDERYRGCRITSHMEHELWSVNPWMGSSTHFSIARFHMDRFLEKHVSFFGLSRRIDAHRPSPLRRVPPTIELVTLADEAALAKLCDYDRSICQLDRSKFLRQWCLKDDHYSHVKQLQHTVMAVEKGKSGKVVGYGTLRYFDKYWGVSPLYADSDDISIVLIEALFQNLKYGQRVYVPTLAKCRTMFEVARHYQLVQIDTEVRNCTFAMAKYVASLAMHKVYCLQEFWPC